MAEGMTPADVGAVVNNNRGWGYGYGDGAGWGMGGMGIGLFAILFLVLFAGGGAWGNNRNQTEFLQTQMQQGFDNQNTMANQREILAATNQVYHDITSYVGDKYAELDRDVLGIGSTLQQVMANQNQCCCNTLRAIDSVNFNAAQNTASINANTTAAVQKVLDAITENKIEALQGKINALELAQATSNIVRYPTGFSYNAGPSPFCGGNCGCGSF